MFQFQLSPKTLWKHSCITWFSTTCIKVHAYTVIKRRQFYRSTQLSNFPTNFLSRKSYRVCSDAQWRRHKEQILTLPYILQSNKSSFSNFHSLYGHFLGWETWLRQPFLQSWRIFQRIDITTPRDFLGNCGFCSVTCWNWAVNWVLMKDYWGRLRVWIRLGFVEWIETWYQCGVKESCSFSHGCAERLRERDSYLIYCLLRLWMGYGSCGSCTTQCLVSFIILFYLWW